MNNKPSRRRNVENKKINVPFYLAVIIFLVLTIMLIKDFKAQRANDFERYLTDITNIVNRDNHKIKILFNQLAAQQKENEDLKNTLAQTKNDLDSLSKKLAQPAPKS